MQKMSNKTVLKVGTSEGVAAVWYVFCVNAITVRRYSPQSF